MHHIHETHVYILDLIREIREANKKCEEGLVTKVKAMLEERYNQEAKEIEEFKVRCIIFSAAT